MKAVSSFTGLSVLVSGAGSIGSRHAKNLRALGVERITVVDPVLERAQTLAGMVQGEAFREYEEALAQAKPDAVFLCVPTSLHVPQALLAAKAGAHLFIEKPLSHSMDGVEELQRIVKQRGCKAMVACNMRFHPGPATVHRLVEEGRIGEVVAARIQTGSYLPAWRPGTDYRKSYSASPKEGGVILDCIHEIDLALWHFGPAHVRHAHVLSAASIGLPQTDGLAEILLEHSSGTLSSVHLNFLERDYRRSHQVIGTHGTVLWDAERGTIDLYGENGVLREQFPDPQGAQDDQSYADELQHFLSAVRDGTPYFSTLEEASAALEIALAARTFFA